MVRKAGKGLAAALAALLLLGSCASSYTSQRQYIEAEAFVKQRNYLAAAEVIQKARGKEYKEKDKVLFYLDLGMLQHYAGLYRESNDSLTQAEYAIEELYTNSISKTIGSALLNDNAQDYKGEVYEDLYINIFKALNYVALDETESALVEVRRVNLKLDLLQDKYDFYYDQYEESGEERKARIDQIRNEFHNSALARYMGTVLYRNQGDYDDARIDKSYYNRSFLTQPLLYPFPVAPPPDSKPLSGEEIPVNVFAFAGQSPTKRAMTYYLDSVENRIVFTSVEQDSQDYLRRHADMESLFFPGVSYGFHMKLQFPRMEKRGIPVSRIILYADGEEVGELSLTENMEHVAEVTFTKELPVIVARTVTRAVIKGMTKEAGQSASDSIIDEEVGGIGGLLLKSVINAATDVAVDATENADLRVSNFFPALAFTGEFYLKPGTYEFRLDYYDGEALIFTDPLGEREIKKGNSLIESYHMF